VDIELGIWEIFGIAEDRGSYLRESKEASILEFVLDIWVGGTLS